MGIQFTSTVSALALALVRMRNIAQIWKSAICAICHFDSWRSFPCHYIE